MVQRLADEGLLRSEWTVAHAANFFLSLITLAAWRALTRELGWTPGQYTENVTRLIEISFLRNRSARAAGCR